MNTTHFQIVKFMDEYHAHMELNRTLYIKKKNCIYSDPRNHDEWLQHYRRETTCEFSLMHFVSLGTFLTRI